MGVLYLAALVAGLGVLLVQVAMGARGGGHDVGGGHVGGGHVGGGHVGAGHAGGHAQGHEQDGYGKYGSAVSGAVAMFLSFRFWIFFALGFGLSGSLLHHLGLASPDVAAAVATGMGFASGLAAALVFRSISHNTFATESRASAAIGATARVLVPLTKGETGQVRIELSGSSVDLLATTDEEQLERDELVLVQDVNGGVAHVAKRPREIV